MSKHVSRKSQWTELSPTRHITFNGYVQKNTFGKWDAVVTYMTRPALAKDKHYKPRNWYTRRENIGEHKRAREAMMAVEDHIKKLRDKNSQDILL